MFPRMIPFVALLCAASAQAAPADSTLERDRAAILAMAGTYTVTFDFEEIVAVQPSYEVRAPYHASADVELVEILTNEPNRIELQHVLLTDGRVVKHWRQEWLYEGRDLYEFAGHDTWRHRRLGEDEARGTWTQRVFQVDDSPRYQGYGRWTHVGGLSSWESNWTWRPLPRREQSRKEEYDVLAGRNRHSLTHTGWVHEQDNYKLALREGQEVVLTREMGLNRYDHVDPAKADAARGYWSRTHEFWSVVRRTWDSLLVPGADVRLIGELDDKPLWKSMLELADSAQANPSADLAAQVRQRIEEYLDPSEVSASRQ